MTEGRGRHSSRMKRRAAIKESQSNLEVCLVGAEVDGHEGEPDDACGVHGERDVLGLVEVLGDLARLERVDGAQQHEHHVVHERQRDRRVRTLHHSNSSL